MIVFCGRKEVAQSSEEFSVGDPDSKFKSREGSGTEKNLIRGGSTPRSDHLPFYIPFLAEKVPLSYTLHWK